MNPGVYCNLTDAEYDAIDAWRSSELNAFVEATPAHYCNRDRQQDDERKYHLTLGSAVHVATLEPASFSARVAERAVMPTAEELGCFSSTGKAGFYTNEQRSLRDKVQAEVDAANAANAGKLLLKPGDDERVLSMADKLRAHPDLASLLAEPDFEPELTIVWIDKETGVKCKARIDGSSRRARRGAEIKTDAMPATRQKFGRRCLELGYFRSHAFYRMGWNAALGDGFPFHLDWYVVETFGVHEVAHYEADPVLCDIGDDEVRTALREYAECLHRGSWPGYPRVQRLELPGWYRGIER